MVDRGRVCVGALPFGGEGVTDRCCTDDPEVDGSHTVVLLCEVAAHI